MRKLFDVIFTFIGIGGVFYFVYQAIYNDDGITALVLRLVAALIIAFGVVLDMNKVKHSKEDPVFEWYIKDEPKGMFLYLLKHGVLFAGVIGGYLTWVLFVDFDNTPDLFISAIKYMATLSIGGIIGAWFSWQSNVVKARELDLDQQMLEDDV